MSSAGRPTVRQLIVCDDVFIDNESNRVAIINLISSYRPREYEYVREEICFVVQLTNCHGPGRVQIVVVFADTDAPVFGTVPREVALTTNPLLVLGLRYHIRNCKFLQPGLYMVRYLFDDEVNFETPLLMRKVQQ